MIEDIRKLAHSSPFVPFTIYSEDGGEMRVPTTDHIAFPPDGKRILVWTNGHDYHILRATLVTRVTVDRRSEEAA
jgi:hypothetical protein